MTMQKQMKPFKIELKLTDLNALIQNCLIKEPVTICKNMKDAHMAVIQNDFVLASANKNANVVIRATGKLQVELALLNREMATSLILGEYLYIGTYVDTLFVFHIPQFRTMKGPI